MVVTEFQSNSLISTEESCNMTLILSPFFFLPVTDYTSFGRVGGQTG